MVNIKKYRGYFNMSQDDLAKKLGITRSMVCYLESKEIKDLSNEYKEKLCEIFDCNVIDLYGLDNFKELPSNDSEILTIIKFLTPLIENVELREKIANGILKRYQRNKRNFK